MKKTLSAILAVLILASTSLIAFAADGEMIFIESDKGEYGTSYTGQNSSGNSSSQSETVQSRDIRKDAPNFSANTVAPAEHDARDTSVK